MTSRLQTRCWAYHAVISCFTVTLWHVDVVPATPTLLNVWFGQILFLSMDANIATAAIFRSKVLVVISLKYFNTCREHFSKPSPQKPKMDHFVVVSACVHI